MPIEPVGSAETARLQSVEPEGSRRDRHVALFEPVPSDVVQSFADRGDHVLESSGQSAGAGEPAPSEFASLAIGTHETDQGVLWTASDPPTPDVDSGIVSGPQETIAEQSGSPTDVVDRATTQRGDTGQARVLPNNANAEPTLSDAASRDIATSSGLERGGVSMVGADAASPAPNVNRPVAAFVSAPVFAAPVPMQLDDPERGTSGLPSLDARMAAVATPPSAGAAGGLALDPRSQGPIDSDRPPMAAFRAIASDALHGLAPAQFIAVPEAASFRPTLAEASTGGMGGVRDVGAGSEMSWSPAGLRSEAPPVPPIGLPLMSVLALLPVAIRELARTSPSEAEDSDSAPLHAAAPQGRRWRDRRHRRMTRGFRRRLAAATAMAQLRAAASKLTSIGRRMQRCARDIDPAGWMEDSVRGLLTSRAVRIVLSLPQRVRRGSPMCWLMSRRRSLSIRSPR